MELKQSLLKPFGMIDDYLKIINCHKINYKVEYDADFYNMSPLRQV